MIDQFEKFLFKTSKLLAHKPRKEPEKTAEGYVYSGLNQRMFALTIDSLILIIILLPISHFLTPIPGNIQLIFQEAQNAAINAPTVELGNAAYMDVIQKSELSTWIANNLALQLGVFYLYMLGCWLAWSTTPGKWVLGLRIVSAKTGARMNSWQILFRLAAYIFCSFTLLGFFWIGFDKKKRGWHDFFADTVVVKTRV